MNVKIKKLHPDARIPQYAKQFDAGLDIVAISKDTSLDKLYVEGGYIKEQRPHIITYGTGLAIEIPEGYVGLLFPRSSIYKYNMNLSNAVGVVDAGFRGEIKFKFRVETNSIHNSYNIGDKVGQLLIIPYPKIELQEVDELSDSERGSSGFGSSGV